MKNIVIILGHPAGKNTSLCDALARAYEKGALGAGHNVSLIDIGKIAIPYLEERENYENYGLPAALKMAQNKMKAATHWVIIYPLWLGFMPAKLKSFLEWVLSPGFAYDLENKKNPFSQKLLKNKSARIIITMGMPAWFYRWFYGAHSLKALECNILKFCGIKPVYKTLFGMVESVSDKQRNEWLQQIKNLGKGGM